jgi:hypothetical protein
MPQGAAICAEQVGPVPVITAGFWRRWFSKARMIGAEHMPEGAPFRRPNEQVEPMKSREKEDGKENAKQIVDGRRRAILVGLPTRIGGQRHLLDERQSPMHCQEKATANRGFKCSREERD